MKNCILKEHYVQRISVLINLHNRGVISLSLSDFTSDGLLSNYMILTSFKGHREQQFKWNVYVGPHASSSRFDL